jgi:hypothetical protein
MKKDLLDEQNDCLRRLGIYLAAGAILKWGNLSEDGFYLFGRDGNGIAEGDTVKELIANIPKGK